MQRPLAPCLWLDDQAEQASRFYLEAFGEGRVLGVSRYPSSGDNPSGKPPGSVMTVEVQLLGQRLTLLDGGPQFTPNPSISFFVPRESPDAVDGLVEVLADGGTMLMPVDSYPWSKRYGWVQDRFGASWQVFAGPRPPGGSGLIPSLLFTGAQATGRAEEAMRTWIELFPDSREVDVSRHPDGTIAQARLLLAGQDLFVSDSPIDHPFAFDEGVSLQLFCRDQAEIDHYWQALSEGGEQGPCGWLTDRFGISWQVVPSDIDAWMTSDDAEARDRAFRAILEMGKLDIEAIRAAFRGA